MSITDDELAAVRSIQAGTTTPALILRSPTELASLFAGYELLDPGITPSAAWRPDRPVDDREAAKSNSLAAVGRLP